VDWFRVDDFYLLLGGNLVARRLFDQCFLRFVGDLVLLLVFRLRVLFHFVKKVRER
jgi:hypothetical protein